MIVNCPHDRPKEPVVGARAGDDRDRALVGHERSVLASPAPGVERGRADRFSAS